MAEYLVQDTTMKAIADAIRSKGNTSAALTPAGMASAIGNISTGVETGDATAAAGDILSGKTAYVNGEKVTGTIESQAAQTITPGTADKTIEAGKYLAGTQTIKGDANLIAKNIKSGVNIFGIAGSLKSATIKTGTVVGQSNDISTTPLTVTGLGGTPKIVFVMYANNKGVLSSASSAKYLMAITMIDGVTYSCYSYLSSSNMAIASQIATVSLNYTLTYNSNGFSIKAKSGSGQFTSNATYGYAYIAIM